jgi:hypothetical protein
VSLGRIKRWRLKRLARWLPLGCRHVFGRICRRCTNATQSEGNPMTREIEQSINIYADHFTDRVERLKEYEFDAADRVLKKNILVSVLDALSRTASNPQAGNRQRFTELIANFADWANHTRASAPHIHYLLGQLRDPSFEKARSFVSQIVANNSSGELIPLSRDPELHEIAEVWPIPAEQKVLGNMSLKSFTHLNLLYEHRNSLVHELREPGYGIEFSDDDTEPYYHGSTHLGSENVVEGRTLELVYPLNFYFRLFENVMSNLKPYLMRNRIDPYDCYRFGSSWIGDLNL